MAGSQGLHEQEQPGHSRPLRKEGLAKPHDHVDLMSHVGDAAMSEGQPLRSCPEAATLPAQTQRPAAQHPACAARAAARNLEPGPLSAVSAAPSSIALRPTTEGRQLQRDFAATRCDYQANRARGLMADPMWVALNPKQFGSATTSLQL